jgi:transposase
LAVVAGRPGSASGTRCCVCCGARAWKTVSRSLGVTAATPSSWRDAFLVAGEASLPPRPEDGASLECLRLEARLGEMLLERELLEAEIAVLEGKHPLARRQSWS